MYTQYPLIEWLHDVNVIECGFLLLIVALILTMKLISYAHVCNDIRRDIGIVLVLFHRHRRSITCLAHDVIANAKNKKTDEPVRAYNPSIVHMYYFLAAPTLCYQESYPRTQRIRKRFVLRRLLELIFCLALQVFIAEQYVLPIVKNSLVHFDNRMLQLPCMFLSLSMPILYLNIDDWSRIMERAMKLAVPNSAIWLLMFYSVFHSYLNLCGELLRFGDRLFYRDWWNAQTLDVYWRNWNLPVHNVLIFFPLTLCDDVLIVLVSINIIVDSASFICTSTTPWLELFTSTSTCVLCICCVT
jgi:diacylglycerol O-acyltransferase-1